MPPSAAMLSHLAQNVTFLVPIWKMTAPDGMVAAYAAHTRNLTYSSVNYTAAPVEPTKFSETLGVQEANHVELFGVFDSIVTESDLQGGRWRNAKFVYEVIAIDPATGVASLTVTGFAKKIRGQAGKFAINNGTFRVEERSLSDLLQQDIGSLTSPLDRNRSPEALGVSMGPFTFARTVTGTPPDRRHFTVNGTAQVNDYFKYGRVEFTSGANNGLKMEIKANVGNVIELQLPTRSDIANGDTVNLIAGYDSTRDQARDKFASAINFDGEPDLPGIKGVVSYPTD
jgi:uncharacterized phage protein (TIGR02218 family)